MLNELANVQKFVFHSQG